MTEKTDEGHGKCKKGTGRKNGNRVLRGGSWNNNDDNLRCANRNNNKPADTNNNNGFRLAST